MAKILKLLGKEKTDAGGDQEQEGEEDDDEEDDDEEDEEDDRRGSGEKCLVVCANSGEFLMPFSLCLCRALVVVTGLAEGLYAPPLYTDTLKQAASGTV